MARIPQHELERLKQDISIQRLAEARGIKLVPHGENLIGLCPFHDDHDPSLVITPKKNLWHCLGACGTGGSVIDWVMTAEGVSFRHAVELLRADLPPAGDRPTRPLKRSTVQKLPAPVETTALDHELLDQVVDYYHQALKESPEALAYLESRGLRSPEMLERFRLGFANRTLGYRLPQKNRKQGKAIRERLQHLGVLRESGHEHLNGSLVIPIHDAEGNVAQLYGRKITPNLRKGTPLHLYLPGPHRGIFNLAALRESKELILCEALIDALTFWQAGFRNVTTSYGINGFTDELHEALRAYGTERVLIAYDRDDAGDNAADKLAAKLGEDGISCFRVRFPRNMDANSYADKVKPASQSLAVLLRSAEYLSGPLKTLAVTPSADPPAEKPTTTCTITESEPDLPLAAVPPPLPEVITQQVAASPVPEPPTPDIPVEISDHEVVITLGERRWRIRGLARNLSYEQLKINLLVGQGEHFHVDSLDLYSARQRGSFLKQAAVELQVKQEVLKQDLGKVLLKLEQLQDEQIRKALEPGDTAVRLSDDEQAAALRLLRDPHLLDRVSADLEACGLVGEHTNKLVGYLATVSRKLAKPLGVLVQSSSAAGKSALMDAVLALVPPEDRVSYSAMTGQSLFYMGETDLKHKVLAIAEEEGAERASYPLKLLQSEGELTIASTGKDPKSGRLTTHEYHVEGPAAILLTTTAIDLDEELLNRCVVLCVDESREQTEAIHKMQREERTFEGLQRRLARDALRRQHQNAQRLVKPLHVVNPHSPRLTFLTSTTRTRRDHLKYHALIESITLLHQYQREIRSGVIAGQRVDYVEATLDDIALANHLAADVLGRTLDELPPQTRRLLFLIHEMVAAQCEEQEIEQTYLRFTRRQVRERTGLGNTQLKIHLHRLEEMEYLLVHRGGRGQSFVYELLYEGEGQDGSAFVLGLIDTDKLEYDRNRSGSEHNRSALAGNWSGSSRPQIGGVSGGGRGGLNEAVKEERLDFEPETPKTTHQAVNQSRENRHVVAVAACPRAER